MSEGYSPLRRWLREERARDHERWTIEERCPHCDSHDVHSQPPLWGALGYGCANGHLWWTGGLSPATLLGSDA